MSHSPVAHLATDSLPTILASQGPSGIGSMHFSKPSRIETYSNSVFGRARGFIQNFYQYVRRNERDLR
jgi:hypothetical protein